MNNLLETMYIKRFCLPSELDIQNMNPKTINKICNCICSEYNHIACVYEGKIQNLKKNINILSFGINKYSDSDGKKPSIHAEYDAISKLIPLKRKKKLRSIDILVIRVSKLNNIQMSKPCYNCIQVMKTLPEKKGYKINNIYYSIDNGNIIKTNLKYLDNTEYHFSKYYSKN
jgi:hypothetical protein